MASKPQNHVTRALDADQLAKMLTVEPWPEVPEDLVIYLESIYPPRCYHPGRENLEEHLDYAGKAELTATLREVFEDQKKPAIALDDEEE